MILTKTGIWYFEDCVGEPEFECKIKKKSTQNKVQYFIWIQYNLCTLTKIGYC